MHSQHLVNIILPLSTNDLSLSVFDSDYMANQVVLEQVVGTLVKYNGSAEFTPYLAESWSVNTNKTEWTFRLKENLKDENGEEIDAFKYEKVFLKLLKIYSKRSSPPVFNQLKGWDSFLKGDQKKLGIKALSDNTIKFKFTNPAHGLLEFLSMPYYGHYSLEDFNEDEWRDKSKITSTGSYKLESFAANEVKLTLREDFEILKNRNHSSFKEIKIIKGNWQEEIKDSENYIISIDNKDQTFPENYKLIDLTPNIFGGVIIGPKTKPFNDVEVRRAFRTLMRKNMDKKLSAYKSLRPSHFLYSCFEKYKIIDQDISEAVTLLKKQKVEDLPVFNMSNLKNNGSEILMNILRSTIEEIGWTVKIHTPTDLGEKWIEKGLDHNLYALRIAGVDIGGEPENWLIKLMFCSRLGISFPDPDQRICEITRNFDSEKYKTTHCYWEDLHNAIEDSSVIVPAFHMGYSWLVSPRINTKFLSPTTHVPRIDQVNLNST